MSWCVLVVGAASALRFAAESPYHHHHHQQHSRRSVALRAVESPPATSSTSLSSEAVAVIESIMDDVKSRPVMTEAVIETLSTFLETYLAVVTGDLGREPSSVVEVMREYADKVQEQLEKAHSFGPLHRGEDAFYELDTKFMEPLIDMEDSVLLGAEHAAEIRAQLDRGENVVLLSNHQTEADPSAWSALFDRGDEAWRDTTFASRMIMVAGDRVTTDPVAVPFSRARNLLCIYSKRHIDKPPELKRQKQLHNTRTMGAMLKLLADGGNMIWVAPSGGRDRPDDSGDFSKPAPFDAKSVDMFRLMASKVPFQKTHFWPTAMLTYRLFPPPPKVSTGGLGEPRIALRGSVNAAFGPELDFSTLDDDTKAADVAYAECAKLYDQLLDAATERQSPYYSTQARRLNADNVKEVQRKYEEQAAEAE